MHAATNGCMKGSHIVFQVLPVVLAIAAASNAGAEMIGSLTDSTTRVTFEVEGLSEPVRIMHLSDTHLNLIDERDVEHKAQWAERHIKFLENDWKTSFEAKLAQAKEHQVDLLALTGDIIHFPSHRNIETLEAMLDQTGIPYLYCPGNHDWLFPEFRESDAIRAEWLNALSPFDEGTGTGAIRDVKGLRFLAFDDSTYSFSADQLAFLRDQVDTDKPLVLLMHIPLYNPSLRTEAVEVWDPHSLLVGDTHWTAEERKGWGARLADTPESLAFLETVEQAENIVAILAGHIHFFHNGVVGENAIQLVTPPPFMNDGHRIVEFLPASRKE